MNRDLRYDIARDISILWIVLVFHLSAYLGAGYNLNNNFSCNNITGRLLVALALFLVYLLVSVI